jgi:hypothetical protein
MGWGLYAMEAAKVGDELLPFVGKQLSGAEFKRMCQANQRFAKYAIHVKKNVIKMEMLWMEMLQGSLTVLLAESI